MRTSSLPAVMSPFISITRAVSRTSRTSNVVAVSGILVSSLDGHEIRQARDLEDLAVVIRKTARPHLDLAGARLREQAHDQRDAGAVDVLDVGEVEDDRAGAPAGRLAVRALEGRLGGRVHVAVKGQHGHSVAVLQRYLKLTCRHRRLLAGARPARGCVGPRRRSRALRRPFARSGTAPSRAAFGARPAWPRGRGPLAPAAPSRRPGR